MFVKGFSGLGNNGIVKYLRSNADSAEFWVLIDIFRGQLLSKPSWLGNITKTRVAFKPELQTQFDAYAVFKFNP